MAERNDPRPYVGELNSQHAATAMQAAMLKAIELLDTADILLSLSASRIRSRTRSSRLRRRVSSRYFRASSLV